MRTAPFSHYSTGQADPRRKRVARPSDPDRPVLEQQQGLLLEVLRRAGGTPVSYDELHDAGVEFPASVVSELELAGVAIERCFGRGPGSRSQVGVRLAPAAHPDPEPVGEGAVSRPIPGAPPGGWEPVRVYRVGVARALLEGALVRASWLVETAGRWARRWTAGRPAIGGRMLAPLALMAAAGVAALVVVSAVPGSDGPRAHAARARYHEPAIASGQVIAAHVPDHAIARKAGRTGTPSTAAEARSTTSTATSVTTSPAAPATAPSPTPASPASASPTPASPASASGLEARGHDLMVAGRYDQAVPVLQRALRATGEQPRACLEPTTQTCLTYAFALYDLGRSLRLAGRPAAAVRILKHRLRIENQRPVVAAELVRARKQARHRAG